MEAAENCPICTESYDGKWFSLGACEHHICHICSLRMRALGNQNNCPLCKTECVEVIFTLDKLKPFNVYKLHIMKRDHKKLGIHFADSKIFEITSKLLRQGCPVSSCNAYCQDYGQLQNHLRNSHKRSLICNLCAKNTSLFSHELEVFTNETINAHNSKVHETCHCCAELLFDKEAYRDHCREKHEVCFLCERKNPEMRGKVFYTHYGALEEHFHLDHFLCDNSACLEKKFIVFDNDLDLQGHLLKEHGSRKKAGKGRPVILDFRYPDHRNRIGPIDSGFNRNDTRMSGGNERRQLRLEKQETSNQGSSNSSTSSNATLESLRPHIENSEPNHCRFKAPVGFGSRLSATPEFMSPSNFPTFDSSTSKSDNAQESSSQYPAPKSREILLTPAQNDVFVGGGQDLITKLQKLIGDSPETMARLKMAFWAFRSNSSSASAFFDLFVASCDSDMGKKNQQMHVMGWVWHRLVELLPEEISTDEIQRALNKKSKKKGLSIDEFEALQRGEPKREAMLRVWNNFKVHQKTDEIMPRKQSSWASVDPPTPPSPKTARVVVIKEKGAKIPKIAASSASSASSNSIIAEPIVSQARASVSSSFASLAVSAKAPVSFPSKVVGPSITRSKADFPALPVASSSSSTSRKPTSRGGYYNNLGVAPSSWEGKGEEPLNDNNVENTNSGKKGKKKGKGTVLLHFG